ncbi:protein-glutamine glutaminase family protein [Peredibacter sp. HCB2-198]|uniref:protein-glutamine glutaminase family protein n=1 Tax=Peredibacter sp. HCB2-198 TaxID=3383025 RepID=UPI0038B5E88B
MKKLILVMLALGTAPFLQAETFKSRIFAVEDNIVKFENGRVAFLNSSPVKLIKNSLIRAEVDDQDSSLISYDVIQEPNLKNMAVSSVENPTPLPGVRPPFEATIVPSMEEAMAIFNRSNSNYKRVSECTDRAHVWAHDEFKRSGIKSKKVFVFFTASYIDSIRFKWWFHVAPAYSVQTPSGVQDMVMDFRYTDRPMTVKEFTDQFVYTKRPCKPTLRFSEYDVNPQTENCYLMIDSMHYKMPGELAAQEQGRYKSTTPDSEIRAALRNGFNSQP